MGKVKADKESKQLYQDPAYGVDGVIAHLNLLKSETEAIFSAPPPKKEEPAAANQPMSEEDAKKEGEQVNENAKSSEQPAKEGVDEANKDIDMKNDQ